MSTYKLYYFSITGRAEVCRFMFKLADQPFEDIRYTFKEWPDHKAETPFGQLPYMEVDGEIFCQSHAMERLLAKRFNLYGSNDMEQARADMIVDCLEDMLRSFFNKSEGTEEGKEERRKKWAEEQFPDYANKLEKFATPTGFMPGKPIMWPDLVLVFVLDTLSYFIHGKQEQLDMANYPKLLAISKVVVADDKISQWIKERPASIVD